VAPRVAVPLRNRPPPRRSEFLAGATLASLIRRRSSPQRRRPRPSAASGARPPSPTASAAAQQLHLDEDWRVLPSSRSSLASAGSGRRRCRCSSLRVAAASSVRRLSSAILRRRRCSLLAMTRRSSSGSPMWQHVSPAPPPSRASSHLASWPQPLSPHGREVVGGLKDSEGETAMCLYTAMNSQIVSSAIKQCKDILFCKLIWNDILNEINKR
jgi:hypothetical protein